MTGIDELRRTLDAHARDLHDDGVPGRADAARTRARAARRQRNALVAGMVAVVVAAAVTAVSWPRSDRPLPADREINGHTAPATLQSLGYTYRYVTGAGAKNSASVGFDAGSGPWLVSWAADPGAPVKVTDGNGEVVGTQPGEFGDFVLVPSGSDTSFRMHGNRAALAVYELTDLAPEGVTEGGITFRDQVGSDTLVGAEIGRPADSDVAFDFEVPDTMLTSRMFCAGLPGEAVLHVRFAGEDAVTTSGGNRGCDDETFDPGGAGGVGYVDGIDVPPGETARVRLWVTDNHNQPVSADGLRIGIGLYAEGEPAERTAAGDVPELQEEAGHLWRLTEVVESRPGDRSLELVDDSEDATLVYHYSAHVGHTLEQVLVDGEEVEATMGIGSGSGPVTPLRPGTATYGIRLGSDASPRAALALAAYERID